jgi:hypothetical protein
MSPQMHKVFRNTSFMFGVFTIVASFAALDQIPDGASWSARYLAVGSAMAPWLISGMIVWAAGEIIKVMKDSET